MNYPQLEQNLLTHGKHQQAIATLTEINPALLEPSLHSILRAVSAVTRIPMIVLISPRRERCCVRARFIYYHVARTRTHKSFPVIGYYCGGRDHTTVMNGLHRAQQRWAEIAVDVAAVTTLLTTRCSVYGIAENHVPTGV